MNRFCNITNWEENSNMEILSNLDKVNIIQEARSFNYTPVDTKKSMRILTRIIYLLHQDNMAFTTMEATEIFFCITKLFQSQNATLRRLLYLCLNELSTVAQDVIIVTSSLTKDVIQLEGKYRAAAIRALCSITDSSLLPNFGRYLKQAIADKDPVVQSAALISALHLTATSPELTRRWINEAQEAIYSTNTMVSYHALALAFEIRRDDKLSTAKFVAKVKRQVERSPYASCLIIRLAARLAEDDEINNPEQFTTFVESCLHNQTEIVAYEAAHAIVCLRKPSKDLPQAVSILQGFCSSHNSVVRLAATRTLEKLAKKNPNSVISCTADLENLISDTNKAVATLAVTMLLTIGTANSIDKIMKRVTNFMSEISDEFKIIIVQVTKSVCLKYPLKCVLLIDFLAKCLKDYGGMQYKTAIFDTIYCLIKDNPYAKETGLDTLCEYLEDCEYTSLSIKILNVLGQEAPKTNQPMKYIRIIYNRVGLDAAPVRAATVAALARIAAARPALLSIVQCLLARCLLDDDDEVRDRAVLLNAILKSNDSLLINYCILNVTDMTEMEILLAHYIEGSPYKPFVYPNNLLAGNAMTETTESKDTCDYNDSFLSFFKNDARQLNVISSLEKIGPLFKSIKATNLTEPGTEYRVCCVKHIYPKHLLLQFDCLNTLCDQILEKVKIHINLSTGFRILKEISCEKLSYNEKGNMYYLLSFPSCGDECIGVFELSLEFIVKMCDPETSLPIAEKGYADSYELEQLIIVCSDQFMMKEPGVDWNLKWNKFSAENESCETYILGHMDINEGAKMICDHFGLPTVCASAKGTRNALDIRGEGVFRTGDQVMMRSRLIQTHEQVSAQMVVRSESGIALAVLLRTMESARCEKVSSTSFIQEELSFPSGIQLFFHAFSGYDNTSRSQKGLPLVTQRRKQRQNSCHASKILQSQVDVASIPSTAAVITEPMNVNNLTYLYVNNRIKLPTESFDNTTWLALGSHKTSDTSCDFCLSGSGTKLVSLLLCLLNSVMKL